MSMRMAFMMTAIDISGAPIHLARTVVEIPDHVLEALEIDPVYLGAFPITTHIGRVRLPQTTKQTAPWVEASVDLLPVQLYGIATVTEED